MATETLTRPLPQSTGFTFSEPLVYFTVLGLFSERLKLNYGVDLKFFYLIVLIGLAAAALRWDFRLNRYHVLALLYLWVTGLIAVLAGTDGLQYYLQEAAGISVCSVYFYVFLRNQQRSPKEVFELYARIAYYVCWLGLLIVPVTSALSGYFRGVQSIMQEPEHFATAMFPAAFFFASHALRTKRYRKEAWVTGLAVFLSGSATAFVGLMIALFLLLRRRPTTLVLAVILGASFAAAMYTLDTHTRIRVDDTFGAVRGMDVTGVNLSTFALVSNLYVTTRSVAEHPWFGVGIGGHRLAHKKFIAELPGGTAFEEYLEGFGVAPDAGSLLLRIISELGLVGLVLIFFFIWRFHVGDGSEWAFVSNGILIYFTLKLLREGHWFAPETYFFVWMYVFAWMGRKRETLAAANASGVGARLTS
jgi:hypothetical protein